MPAHSEPSNPSAQALAIGAGFLVNAAAPPQTAAICLVDTGVDPNPDTTAVVDRLAVTGEPGDLSPTHHGTAMAMHIAAPANRWGMVGIWPAARIVSVRANLPGQDEFATAGYISAIKLCDKAAAQYGIRVVELALAGTAAPSEAEAAQLADVVQAARSHGLNVVAAAGNRGGMPVGVPANIPGVLAIGAVDASGARCSFSAVGAPLLAPGCGLNAADPLTGAPDDSQQGTSQASAIAAAALAALRGFRPDLGPDAAEQVLRDTATSAPGGPMLNLAAAFSSQGLGAMLAAAPPAVAAPTDTPAAANPPGPDLAAKPKSRLPRPKLAVRTGRSGHRHTLTIRASNRPRGARLRVQVYRRTATGRLRRIALMSRVSSTVTAHVGSWTRLTGRYDDPTESRAPSASTTVKATAKRGTR